MVNTIVITSYHLAGLGRPCRRYGYPAQLSISNHPIPVRPLCDEELKEMRTFLMLRCFYGLGWLQTHPNSEAAQIYTEPLIFLTGVVGEEFLRAGRV